MLHKTKTWLATFDGASARFFSIDWAAGALTPLDLGPNQSAHRPVYPDAPTTTHKSFSPARGAGDRHPDPGRALESAFVREVADFLGDQCANHAFENVIIAASPRALGAFRDAAGPELAKHIAAEILGDYVQTPIIEIYALIAQKL
ncbi:MAG: host attachment protein [Caulobacterales bacterium]|jgi:protein required for attachment to host cells